MAFVSAERGHLKSTDEVARRGNERSPEVLEAWPASLWIRRRRRTPRPYPGEKEEIWKPIAELPPIPSKQAVPSYGILSIRFTIEVILDGFIADQSIRLSKIREEADRCTATRATEPTDGNQQDSSAALR